MAVMPPPIDPEVVASTPPRIASSEADPGEQEMDDAENEPPPSSQSSTKENDAPTDIAAARRRTSPGYDGYEISPSQQTEEMPPPPMEGLETQRGALPPDLLSAFQMSTRTLEHDFAHSPPYTIQRLAELVLFPKKHYRFLPAFLRALDRAVSVSSPLTDFPLPALQASPSSGFLTNGDAHVNGLGDRGGLSGDEGLGGALLTPIPWLRNQNNLLNLPTTAGTRTEGGAPSDRAETMDRPHGAETGHVTVNGVASASSAAHTNSSPVTSPTLSEQSDASSSSASSTEAQLREQGGLTQGELLRREQEAGMVPTDKFGEPLTSHRTLIAGGAVAVGRQSLFPNAATGHSGSATGTSEILVDDRPEEHPHARGPDVIGMEDMGPQQHPHSANGEVVLDMEAAAGRSRSESPPTQAPIITRSELVPQSGGSTHIANDDEDDVEDDDDDDEMEEVLEPGKPGRDPKDVEKDVEMLKEAMDREKEAEAKDADGDVIVADADGKSIHDNNDDGPS